MVCPELVGVNPDRLIGSELLEQLLLLEFQFFDLFRIGLDRSSLISVVGYLGVWPCCSLCFGHGLGFVVRTVPDVVSSSSRLTLFAHLI